MNFLLVNVTFLEVVIIIYDAIITANPYPNTANLLEIIEKKKKNRRWETFFFLRLAYRWVGAILLLVPIHCIGTYNSIALTHWYIAYKV